MKYIEKKKPVGKNKLAAKQEVAADDAIKRALVATPSPSAAQPVCNTVQHSSYVASNGAPTIVTVTLTNCIDSPSNGDAVVGPAAGTTITVSGHGTVANSRVDDSVQIILGDPNTPVSVNVSGNPQGDYTWSWSGKTPVGTPAGSQLTITATASTTYYDRQINPNGLPAKVSVTVVPDTTPPTLNITSPQGNVQVLGSASSGATIEVDGTASAHQFGVQSVAWMGNWVAGPPTAGAARTSDGFAHWNTSIQVALGTYTITFTCTDNGGNTQTQTLQVQVFAVPTDIFGTDSQQYLQALIEFATKPAVTVPNQTQLAARIQIRNSDATPGDLKQIFRQSFSDLMNVSYQKKANEQVHKIRLCIEVLRECLSPVAYWKFDEGSGTTASDFSGNGLVGTIQGATWAPGKLGGALSFDGAGAYVQVGNLPELKMTTAFSIAAWIYPTGPGSPTQGGTICNKENEYEIARFPDGSIQWAIANTDPGWQWIDTHYTAGAGQWTHIAVIYDGRSVTTYANGTPVHTSPASGPIISANPIDPNNHDFRIGGRQEFVQFFQGQIDEVKVFSRALSGGEVALLYQGIPDPTLAAAEASYRQQAYETLLTQLGTSFDEIRLARSSRAYSDSARQALADRLGITIDRLPALLLDPNAALTGPLALSEAALEQLFGLEDTTRDPLSDGTVLGDTQAQIIHWTLDGVEWNRNTDPEGFCYLSLSKDPTGLMHIKLFSDSLRNTLIASESDTQQVPGTTNSYWVNLSPQNNSGISGRILVAYQADTQAISLSVIPQFLGWQMRRLQSIWAAQDFPLLLTQVTPSGGQSAQQNLSVAITGRYTHFVQGATTADFGEGVKVVSLTVKSPTSATAVLNIDPAAAEGTRDVTLTTHTEVVTSSNAFRVVVVVPAEPVLAQVNPPTGQPGKQNLRVAITGQSTHFATGTTATFGAGVRVVSLTVNSPTSATAVLNIDPTAAGGSRDVTLTTGTEVVTLSSGFTVAVGTPVLTQVYPNTGQPGEQNLGVIVAGQATHFGNGTTMNFGAGVTVVSLAVTSPTSATAVLNIDPAAATAARDVVVATGGEVLTLRGGFTVTTGAPVLTQMNPTMSQPGQQGLLVTITGQYTHFVNGTTQAGFGSGISVVSLTVNSATSATAVLNIDAAAAVGVRDVTLTTNTEAVTLLSGLTVEAPSVIGPPIIDPDLLFNKDFKHPSDSAYMVYRNRQQLLQAWYNNLKPQPGTMPPPQEHLDTILRNVLGKTSADLVALDKDRSQGTDISWQLATMNLSVAAFNYLLRIAALVDSLQSSQDLLASEWNDVYNILVQALKLGAIQVCSWRSEEQSLNLTLGPDWFQISPATDIFPSQASPWRAMPAARQAWLSTLRGRINQREDLRQGLQASVDATEVATLSVLRDALAAATAATVSVPIPGLLSSGVDATTPPGALAQLDGHWTIIFENPSDKTRTINAATVTRTLGSGWLANSSSSSNWISPQAKEQPSTDPSGSYTYRTVLDLSGLDYLSAWIKANVAVDDHVTEVQLNGYSLNLVGLLPTIGSAKFTQLDINSGFTAGLNVLDFKVSNIPPNPTGLRVEFSSSMANALPEKLTEWLSIDFGCASYQSTTRLSQAIETLQALFFSLRTDGFKELSGLVSLQLNPAESRAEFDTEWTWIGSYATWVAAMRVFLYPENLLLPTLRDGSNIPPTPAFQSMVDNLLRVQPVKPQDALDAVAQYLSDIRPNFDASSLYGGLFSTGIDNTTGAPLLDGAVDPNWRITAVPGITLTQPVPAYANVSGVRPSSSTSSFISPNANATTAEQVGNYTYQTKFDFSSLHFTSLHIATNVEADDQVVDVNLNGQSLGLSAKGYSAFTSLAIDGADAGKNTLEVIVYNAGTAPNPTGLRLQFSALPPRIDPRKMSRQDLIDLRNVEAQLFSQTPSGPNLIYLKELFYFVPLYVALQLQQSGEFAAALDWFRIVYASDLPETERKIYYGLLLEESIPTKYDQLPKWLLSVNPHDFAVSRANAYTRFTLLSLVRLFLDFADTEYTQDTFESLPRARTLYQTALDLLDLPELLQPLPDSRVVANPVAFAMRQHAETNLFKLRTARDIAGLVRVSDSAAFLAAGVSTITPGSIVAGASSQQPTVYRYTTLIDRARQLVGLAQQLESSFLAALEKADAEKYTALKARQDLQSAGANIQLQSLKVKQAADGVTLSSAQQQKSQLQVDHYQGLINAGASKLEKLSLDLQMAEFRLQEVAFAFYQSAALAASAMPLDFGASIGSNVAASVQAVAGATSTMASRAATMASYERRAEEWQFQRDLASKDLDIAKQQYTIAQDQQSVATQEQAIAQTQQDHAQAVVDFLTTQKFTNAVLYEWMSGILQRVYSYFLQQASAVARMAQNQLAFERQAPNLNFIQSNYWQPPSNTSGSQPSDTKGLTGSARLLEDITQLDQFAFQTDQRKLQLTQMLSLAQLDPFAFQQFRETGVLRYATPMDLFDRYFPGHVLRLIKRVRVSVIALIPPTQGIRASLTNPGVSRVVIADPSFGFHTVTVRREPQLVALTSPVISSGLFVDLADTQSGMLLPFENLGVDTVWEFMMPQAANPFDFTTIADVLLTIDYTALDSPDYRQQVLRQLNRPFGADRAYSFRQQFADAWYDLNNPDPAATHIAVQFTTALQDFPPNLQNLAIAQILLYFVPSDGASFQIAPTLTLTPSGPSGTTMSVGGTASLPPDANSLGAAFSTRRGNADAWISMVGRSPIGNWSLDVPNTPNTPNLFQNGQIQDILFVITYSGELPAWPL